MNKSTLSKHWPWVTTAFLAVLLWVQTCNVTNLKEDKAEQAATITQLDLDKQELKSITNKQGETISKQKVIITNSTKALDNLTDTIFNLKNKDAKNSQTIAYLKLNQRVRIDSVYVPIESQSSIASRLHFSDSILKACQEVIDAIEGVSIQVPAIAFISDSNISLRATVNKDNLQIDSLVIHDELNVRFVEKKGKLFKPKTVEVQFFHSNPYFDTQTANSIIYRPKKKSFIKRVLLPIAIGFGAGLLIK